MLKIVKAGGITLGTGVLVGLGVVGWMRIYPPETSVASTPGGTMVLDASATPPPNSSSSEAAGDSLRVSSPIEVAANPVTAQALPGLAPRASRASEPSAHPAARPAAQSVPGPAMFKQYEQYSTSATTMIGDIEAGTGAQAVQGSTLVVKYRGWLSDGTLFDSSYQANKPFSFVLGDHHVIAGWDEGLYGMKVGGTRRLIVPASKGYGAQATGGIPANSMLIFDVELMEVK